MDCVKIKKKKNMFKNVKYFILLLIFVVISNFFEIVETHNNPFGNVRYEMEMDSAEVSKVMFDFATIKYNKLISEGEKDTFFFNPLRWKDEGDYRYKICEDKIEIWICVRNNHELWLVCAKYHDEEDRNFICKFLSDGCFEHDYIVWQSFEKEVLDKLSLKYEKDWGHLIRNWYARWFFDNQLYLIGVAVLIYFLIKQIKKYKGKKQ